MSSNALNALYVVVTMAERRSTFLTPPLLGPSSGQKHLDVTIRSALSAPSKHPSVGYDAYKIMSTWCSSPQGPWTGKGTAMAVSRKVERTVVSKVRGHEVQHTVMGGRGEGEGRRVGKVEVLEGMMLGFVGRRQVEAGVRGRGIEIGKWGKDFRYYR
ncbi:hypothetical protein TrRE_jg5626 [Triparma retinervis]|uniref:Uncharacterized protein n=1 Tax=Triparma retinervis TaxID=2557542 RepID=A0A9W6ZYG1_9STRA|nr:hypothetical protein TrRE_jg5626 [Triparma retinervis]